MENRLNRFIKVVIALFTVLLLGVIGGFVTSVGAEEIDDIMLVKTESERFYIFYPNGYTVDGGELIEFTGTYILTGSANENVTFAGNSTEDITYNVILNQWDAYAKDWYGLLGVEEGVTLNLTVCGENRIYGYNHAGITGKTVEEVVSWVNITVMENSSLSIGRQHSGGMVCISSSVGVTLNSEATSSLDMSDENWRTESEIVFTRGTPQEHSLEYTYSNDETCLASCGICGAVNISMEHTIQIKPLESGNENIKMQHSVSCASCEHSFELVDHTIAYEYTNDEKVHLVVCKECHFTIGEAEHSTGEMGCIDCEANYVMSITVNGETTKYFTLEGAVEAVNAEGGTIKLLADFTPEDRKDIEIADVQAIIDLNGFLLKNTRLEVNSDGAKITVIDSSENKTGLYENKSGYSSSSQRGSIEYNGITIGWETIAVSHGSVAYNNVKTDDYFLIMLQAPDAYVELTNVVIEKTLNIEIHFDDNYDNCILINSGSFSSITLAEIDFYDGENDVTVKNFLPDGYAFSGKNGIIDANKKSISGVASVVEHKEHSFDGFDDLGYTHIRKCACGENEGGKELHEIDESLSCTVCGAELAGELTSDGEVKYFASIESAVEYANELDNAVTIKLLRDKSFTTLDTYGEITLDLNGYTLEYTENRIYVFGKFTLTDSSEAKTGKISSGDDISYIFQIIDGATLVIDGGSVFGLIYTIHYSDRLATNTVIINDGRFIGTENLRIGAKTHLEINGGWFENRDGVIDIWGGEAEIVISGGVFANSRFFKSDISEAITSISDILGTDDSCALTMVDERGNEIELSQLLTYFDGKIIVAHKGVAVVGYESTHALVCPECNGEVYVSEHNSFEYSACESDNTVHNKNCGICGMSCEAEKHTGGHADCTNLAECELCGEAYGETAPDVHSGGNASCNELAKCERCNTPYGEYNPRKHTSTETTLVDTGNNHGKSRVCCGEILVSYNHVYDNVCDNECNECKAKRKITHTYATDGKCISCGADGGAVTESEGNGLSTGAIIGTAVGSVVVFGGGAFALIWFVLRKRYL